MKVVRVFCLFGCLSALAASGAAAVAVGENLLLNGRFECDQVDFPPEWRLDPVRETHAEWRATGGPNGLPSLSISSLGGVYSKSQSIRQLGIRLASGGRYRLSCKVRTRGFDCKGACGLSVINLGWETECGLAGIPAEAEGRWTEVQADFKGFESRNGRFIVLVYARNFTGVLEVADMKLVPLDAIAASGSARPEMSPLAVGPRIVPWNCSPCQIPSSSREVAFRFLGNLPEGSSPKEYDMTLSTGSSPEPSVRPLHPDGNGFTLPGGETNGVLTVSLVCRATGSNIVSRAYRYHVREPASAVNLARHVRKNNLVTEVLNERTGADGAGRFAFGVRRGGWVFIAVEGCESCSPLAVELDGKTVIRADTPCHETFREIEMGDHVLSVSGAGGSGMVVVRTVPELFNNCLAGPPMRGIESRDWAFYERYVMPAMTTAEFVKPGCGLAEFRDRGRQFVQLGDDKPLKTVQDMSDRLLKLKELDAKYDRICLGEQFFWEAEKNAWYVEVLNRFDLEDGSGRPYHCWWIGKPVNGIANAEALAVCSNVSDGRSRVMLELYCRSRATEKEASAYMSDYVRDTVLRCRRVYPPVIGNLGVALCNAAGTTVFSVLHHPEVDFRYFLEMQVRLLALDPVFDGLGGVGYWGAYYADRENLVWSYRLLRHYCVEGRTDSLSAREGLRYLPGHVRNGDFRTGLEDWDVRGAVSCESFRGLGEKNENRWRCDAGQGDAYAALTRGKEANWISQRLKGLVPGRRYYLRYFAFDANALGSKTVRARRVGIDVRFGKGVRVDEKAGWVASELGYDRDSYLHPNVGHVEFVAQESECRVGFTDARAESGEKLGINGIGVYPCTGVCGADCTNQNVCRGFEDELR